MSDYPAAPLTRPSRRARVQSGSTFEGSRETAAPGLVDLARPGALLWILAVIIGGVVSGLVSSIVSIPDFWGSPSEQGVSRPTPRSAT